MMFSSRSLPRLLAVSQTGEQDGEREREEDLDRLAVSSTVHPGTDFLISAYFLPLDLSVHQTDVSFRSVPGRASQWI